MEYNLKIGKETIPVEVKTSKSDNLNLFVKGADFDVDYALIDSGHIHMAVNGKRVNAYVESAGRGKRITVEGASFFVEDSDSLELVKKGGKKESDISDSITPPMPAVVIAILVKPGDTVTKGQGVIVVSAMKMETTLFAPYSGKITGINAAEGQKVSPGDILADIEKDELVE